MVFEFIFGVFPFGNDLEDPFAIYQSIVTGKLSFPRGIKATDNAKKIIELLLTKNPAIRF
jgi:cGMP-dependent protein kinase